jgi:hypothetical protein
VAHPQIAAFARLATENSNAERVLAGQETLLSRTMHGISYDEVHDLFLVPNPFAQSVLMFKGDANGQDKPLRVIQGPRTTMMKPDAIAVDGHNSEIYIPDIPGILVFPEDGNGDVAPVRVVSSPDWKSGGGVAIDPVHNLMIVPGRYGKGKDRKSAIMIFNRTDKGAAEPKAVIGGPKSLGAYSVGRCVVYPPKGIFVCTATIEIGQGEVEPKGTFLGVWSINDNGDVPPRWKIEGSKIQMKRPLGITLNPKNREVIVSDMRLNSVLTYSLPEMF